MEPSCKNFVNLLTQLSPGLEATQRETLSDWLPDDPPITTMFAALGDRIADDFDRVSQQVNQQIFNLLETAMESGDIALVTAVATGLIEALVSRAAQVEGLWLRMRPFLGFRSLLHAQAWLAE